MDQIFFDVKVFYFINLVIVLGTLETRVGAIVGLASPHWENLDVFTALNLFFFWKIFLQI